MAWVLSHATPSGHNQPLWQVCASNVCPLQVVDQGEKINLFLPVSGF